MRHAQFALVAVACLACAGATCLYSGAGPIDPLTAPVGGGWSPVLAVLADLLTVPLPTSGIADVRDVVLPVALAAALIIICVGGGSQVLQPRPWQARFAWCAVGVIAWALASAAASHRWELAWGWIVRFASGACWAWLIARCFNPQMRRWTALLVLGIGPVALVIAFAHRADRGYAHLSWPIGPITLTATLTAVWAAMGLVLLVTCFVSAREAGAAEKRSYYIAAAFVGLVASVLSLMALHGTGRRAPAMGLVAAMLIISAVLIVRRRPRPILRNGVIVGFGVALVAGIAYVVSQASSTDRVRSGPVRVRLAYLAESARLIREHPLLGVGPDQFVVAMTNRIAPRRAVSPQVFHGDFDPTAHNEWLQAAVGLGLPAALLYLVLPLIALVSALRRGEVEGTTWAIAAGLIALCAAECAGITLRGPIVPMWYWTLIGLLLGSEGPDAATAVAPVNGAATVRERFFFTLPKNPLADARGSEARNCAGPSLCRPTPPLRSGLCSLGRCSVHSLGALFRALCGLGAVACLCACALDQFGAMRTVVWSDAAAPPRTFRLFSEKAIMDRYADAEAISYSARGSVSSEHVVAAVAAWRDLWLMMPAYSDTAARYASSLLLARNPDEARRVLATTLGDDLAPYDYAANLTYATLIEDPLERVRCVQRALRNSALDQRMRAVLGLALRDERVVQTVMSEAEAARRAAGDVADEDGLRGAAPELLRILAARSYSLQETDAAIADQRLAAECYRRLEQSSHAYRRGHGAEYDAWSELARMIRERRPEHWREAYLAILEAERFAVMGIPHEEVADADASLGYVGGEVAPTQFPDELRPLWRLSALLHVIAGEDRYLNLRVFAGLPPERWTQADLDFELYNLALQAHEHLSSIPPEDRPPHFKGLAAMAAHYLERIRGTKQYEKLIAE